MKKVLAIGVSVLITLVLSWLLLRSVPFSALRDALDSVSLIAVLVGFVMAVLISVFRGMRYWLLLRGAGSLDKLTSIVCVHNLLINVMPVRTGELGFPYFARKIGIPAGTSVGALIVGRLFDLFALVTLLFVGAVFVPGSALFAQAKLSALVVTGIVLLLLILTVLFRHAAHRVVHAFANKPRISQHNVGVWLVQKVEEVLHGLDVLKSPFAVLGAYGCSVLNWLAQAVITLLMLQAVGIEFSFAQVLLAMTLANLVSAVPINGFAGFGTVEAIWAGVLVAMGVPLIAGVSAGLLIHVANLGYTAVLGLYGSIRLAQYKKV